MTRSVMIIGASILVGSVIIAAAIHSRPASETIESRSGKGAAPEGPPNILPQAVSGYPKTDEAAGTLAVSAEEPNGKARGWFFINGVLYGVLPLHQEIRLRPNEYEIRCVTYRDHEWFTMSGKVPIRRGQSTPCTITRDAAIPYNLLAAPAGFTTFTSNPLNQGAPAWLVNATCADYERSLMNEMPASIREGQQRFLNSPEWQAVERANLQSPARRHQWMNIPRHLGGAREMDAEQVRSLRRWLIRYCNLCQSNGSRPPSVIPGDTTNTPERRSQVNHLADELNRNMLQFQDMAERSLDRLITALENAPVENGQR